ncbi:MAG: universal stress protein [Gammaproteobacteria bacterium]
MEKIGHVLVPVDGSGSAIEAAAMAGLLARNCSARVTVLVAHGEAAIALPGLTEAALPGSVPFNPFPKKEARKHFEAAASEHVIPPVEAALGAVPGGISVVQVWGHAAAEICDYAAANAVDLIVMGKRGGGTFKRLLLGSVSAQVVAHAPCAVTVVA